MKKLKKKKEKTMIEVSKGFEGFIDGQEINKNNGRLFEATLKKATKPKPRGSK